MNAMTGFALDNRMTVVLFAGMGGGCDGLEEAGFHVHVAINHDPVAVAVHEKRHPHTKHLRCDVFEADPRKVTNGRGVRVLHASPDCTHFSVAKGSKPVSKRRRSLAWVICRWAGTVRPETITMENVQEIRTWGPLIAKRDPATGRVMRLDGSIAAKGERVPVQEQWLVPDPRHKGRIWRAWLKHLRGLGYSFDYRILICADYGVTTIRKRFFGVAQADGRPIVWPARTHAPRKDAKHLGLKPWLGAHTIIDWSLPVKSIFGRKKPLAEATLRRTARGVMRYVVDAAKPFIVPITHSGGDRVHDAGEPLRTLTTAHRGELAVVSPALIRTDQQSAAARNGVHSVEEPINTLHTSSGIAMMGATIVGAGGRAAQSAPRDLDEPLGTTTGKEDRILVAAHLSKFNQNGDGSMPDEPLPTVMAGAPRHAVVAASLVQAGYGEREGQAPRSLDIEAPLGAQVAGGGKHALIAAFLAQHNGDPRVDGSKEARPGRPIDEPLGAFTTSPQVGVSAAFIAQHNTGEPGRSAEDPLSTIVTLGSTQGVVAAALGNLYGTNRDGRTIEEPLATVAAGGNHAHLILGFLQHYFGSGKQDDDVRQPLGALTGKARYGLVEVMVKGVPHYIDDIGIRMLEPEEGAAAHGFKPGSLPDEITIDGKTRRLTKTEKYHLVGNSVPPRMIKLIAECNVQHAFAEAAE
ncbi:MAG: DNA cytosine methyltransferase [Mesorhizobium sp.]|uniref:DNA cytosine methyltransferase n=2 Tax=Mesorhizobium sp. TaxID=1871066 RepID=UPI0012287110|nr:DNA cytosine methyltransferase [Mesorhizobium sp.]TIP24872.1 MAG: DNA cytosine methyltransferase [Mesorhizobium sp.]TJV33928.1 MAG: DNA cytosine methyltransferase [Mesorhizobium sp.]